MCVTGHLSLTDKSVEIKNFSKMTVIQKNFIGLSLNLAVNLRLLGDFCSEIFNAKNCVDRSEKYTDTY